MTVVKGYEKCNELCLNEISEDGEKDVTDGESMTKIYDNELMDER